jgi:hypothetical protein
MQNAWRVSSIAWVALREVGVECFSCFNALRHLSEKSFAAEHPN